ncbi:MAG: hypothetical protein GZ094_18400 [Mariniphaga sp.]|nr:hypothetical protein [Mariniphaga sp.]
MKTRSIILAVALLLMCSCTTKELDKTMALQLIQKEKDYPRILDYDVFCSDPAQAKMLLNSGLEGKGYVVILRTQKLKDAGNPLIVFTDKATPYLLPTSEKDKALNVQKVKLAEEILEGIISIKTSKDGKTATVEYTTITSGQTPFSILQTGEIKKKDIFRLFFAVRYRLAYRKETRHRISSLKNTVLFILIYFFNSLFN